MEMVLLPEMMDLRTRLGRAALWAAGAAFLAGVAWIYALGQVPRYLGHEVGGGFEAVEASLCVLDRDGSAKILVAGDSRAKAQIIPAILTARTKRSCVNVAEAVNFGGDLTTLVNVLRRNPQYLASAPALVLSVSQDGVNDLSFQNASMASLLNWTSADHLGAAIRAPFRYLVFMRKHYLPALLRLVRRKYSHGEFTCDGDVRLSPYLIDTKGWRPFQGRDTAASAGKGTHERYLLKGGRWRSMVASLEWLARSPARPILLFVGPVDPSWRASAAGTRALAAEARFSKMVALEAARHPDIHYLDFFQGPPPELDSLHFYNSNHLNAQGSEVFSRILADSLTRVLAAPRIRTRVQAD